MNRNPFRAFGRISSGAGARFAARRHHFRMIRSRARHAVHVRLDTFDREGSPSGPDDSPAESSDPRFKTLRFRLGMNGCWLEGPRRRITDTRNGAGKTSVIELVHFLLGSDWERGADPAIVDDVFILEFDLGPDQIAVSRNGRHPSRVHFHGETDFSQWPIQPERRNESLSMRVDDWNAVLGQLAFALPAEYHEDRFRPKFRGLFSYFVRRVKDGAFAHPHAIHTKQRVWDQQVAVTYLLGLDWTIPRDMELIRTKEDFAASCARHC